LDIHRCVSFLAFIALPICTDGNSHGSHVARTAAARDNSIGVVGTAPGARIWALKVLADNGRGDDSDVLEALYYVAANAREIDVANLSLGHIGFSFPYFLAINIPSFAPAEGTYVNNQSGIQVTSPMPFAS
jgi:subtilisin family serine protease